MAAIVTNFLESSTETPAKTALLVSAILATGYTVYSLFGGSSNADLAPAVTEEEAREMMKAVYDRVRTRAPQLLRAAEGIKQQIAAQGQEISDAQLMQAFILPHFENAVRDSTDEVLAEYDVDEDELEEAVNTYVEQGDMELQDITKSLTVLYQQFGGTTEEDGASSSAVGEIQQDDFIEMMHELAENIIETSTSFVRGWVESKGRPTTASDKEAFQTALMSITEK